MDVIKIIPPADDASPFAQPTADVSDVKRKFLDVAYANESESQKMDIYLPDDGEGPFPAIVFMHGGAFWGGERRDSQFLYFANGIRRGYVVVSLDYRLSNEAKFPAAIHDAKAAIRFLRANAEKYCIDAEHIAAAGDSAGAYLASILGATPNIGAFEDLSMGNAGYSSQVQAVIGMFGVYDPLMQSQFTENAVAPKIPNFMDIFMGFNCRENPALAMFGWPGSYVNTDCAPMLLQAGSGDEIVPYLASSKLVNKINSICGESRAEYSEFDGCRHGDPAYGTPEAEEARFAFLDKHLK